MTTVRVQSSKTVTIRVKETGAQGAPAYSTDSAGVYTIGSANIGFTPEGGIAKQLTNRTGAASVKGTALNYDPDNDDSVIVATNPYVVVGWFYENGVADGGQVWVVYKGVCDMLLEDGYGANPDDWVRMSSTVNGRMITQNRPGYDIAPASVAYTRGSAVSGTLNDLQTDNGSKYVMGEQTGGPGLDVVFTFSVDEAPNRLSVVGYYANNHAAGVQIQVYDYVALNWVLKETMPASGTQDVTYTIDSITADNVNGAEMKVRLYHPDSGTANHRIYVDKMVMTSTADTDHFRECGHVTRVAAAGTDVLARVDIHLL